MILAESLIGFRLHQEFFEAAHFLYQFVIELRCDNSSAFQHISLACSPKADPDAMRDWQRASAAELST